MVILVLTRLPWLSKILYDFDSIAFARGLEHFDVSVHSPHPPGYALYIALGKLSQLFLLDPNRAFVWISVLSSAITIGLFYVLGRRFLSRETGLIASGLLITSPLFWTFGEVCVPYTFSALFSCLIALLIRSGIQGRERHFFLAGAAIGLGSGFRPEILIVMSPLWLYSIRNLTWRKIALALFLSAACFALWFLPSVILSNGWDPFLEAVKIQKMAIWSQGILVNLSKILFYTLWGLGAGCLFLPLAVLRLSALKSEFFFFLLWILPYVLLATFVGFGQPGMLLVILPPVILLISMGLSLLFFPGTDSVLDKRLIFKRRIRVTVVLLPVLLGNILLFTKAPFLSPRGFLEDKASFVDKVDTELFLLSGKGIKFTDRYYGNVISFVRREFDPSETLIFTNFKGWAYASYYLRSYRIHNYFCFYGPKDGKTYYVPEGNMSIPSGVKYIVLFNGDKHSIHFQDTLSPYNRNEGITRSSRISDAFEIQFLNVSGKKTIHFQPGGFWAS